MGGGGTFGPEPRLNKRGPGSLTPPGFFFPGPAVVLVVTQQDIVSQKPAEFGGSPAMAQKTA